MEKLQHNIKFVTGILSTVGHSITLCIFRDYNEPRLGVFLTVGTHTEKVVEVNMIDANYVALDEANIEYSLSKCPPPKDLIIPSENFQLDTQHGNFNGSIDFWMSTCGWHEGTAMIFLTFHVITRHPPKIVNEEQETFTQELNVGEHGKLDISTLFLEDKFSDISVKCQSKSFPAHRLILAQVKHFDTMLSTRMKETLEGVINMDDMDPSTCRELLRFIYQGKVENLSSCINELYAAADKYGIVNLKGMCEQYLYNHITPENALEVYDLSQMHGSAPIAKRAKDVIISNKDKFAPDPETLKIFTCKYPDLVFELLKMT